MSVAHFHLCRSLIVNLVRRGTRLEEIFHGTAHESSVNGRPANSFLILAGIGVMVLPNHAVAVLHTSAEFNG
jgi:hypothetical protein